VSALDPFSPQLQLQFGWCAEPPLYGCGGGRRNFAYASLALVVGAVVGCLVCRFVAEVGRVFALRMICCFVVPGSLIAAFAFDTAATSGLWMLIAGRFIAGIGVGWVCICCPLYVSEAVATEHRGKFLMVSFLSQAAGSLAASLLGLAARHPPGSPGFADTPFDRWWWRAVLLTPVPLCLLSLLSLARLRETPYILCKRGDPAAAQAFLKEVHGGGADPAELREEFEAASGQAERSLSETLERPEARLAIGGKRGEYRHALFVGASLGLLQNLSGGRALLTSSASIFEAAGLQPYDANVAAAMLALLLVLSILASLLIIDDWGRRKSLLVSFSGQALSALVGAAGYWAGKGDVPAIVGIFLFMLAYGLGVAGIPCAYVRASRSCPCVEEAGRRSGRRGETPRTPPAAGEAARVLGPIRTCPLTPPAAGEVVDPHMARALHANSSLALAQVPRRDLPAGLRAVRHGDRRRVQLAWDRGHDLRHAHLQQRRRAHHPLDNLGHRLRLRGRLRPRDEGQQHLRLTLF
jgi:MFS family permease